MSISPEHIVVLPDNQEDYIIYDRTITENLDPPFNKNILVCKDNCSNRLYFNIYYTFDDRELEDKTINIIWINAKKEEGMSVCTEKYLVGNRLTFAWDVPVEATWAVGKIEFSIRITAKDYIWNSLTTFVEVKEGLNYDTSETAVAPIGWVNYLQNKYAIATKRMTWEDYNNLEYKNERVLYIVTKPDTSIHLYLGSLPVGLPTSYFDLIKAIVERTVVDLELPEGITEVRPYFLGNQRIGAPESLISLKLPNSLEKIGQYAFYSTANLSTITWPDSTTPLRVGAQAFAYCNALTSLTLPKNFVADGIDIFMNCSNLTSVYIPDEAAGGLSRDNSCWGLFDNCRKLTDVRLPEGLEWIPINCFEYCTTLVNIVMPNSVTALGYNAFSQCTNLANITWSNSVKTLGSSAFDSCKALTSVEAPSVESIDVYTFRGCSNLATIKFMGIKTIAEYAFITCSKLRTVYLGSQVTSIDSNAFYNLVDLANIYIDLPSTQTQITVPSNKWGASHATIHWNDE